MRINLENGKYINITIKKNAKGTYEYYNGNILLGVYTPDVMKNSKFFEIDLEKNNTLANELSAESKDEIKQIIAQVKEQIHQLDKNDIESEAKENEAIDGYMKSIGMDREKVKSITVVDLKRDKKNETESKKQENDLRTQQNPISQQANNQPRFTTSNVNIKQEINLEERATDVQDFKRFLGGKLPENISKIGVIESDDLSEMKDENGNVIDNSSTRYGLVAIGKNSEVEPLKKYIPELEQNHSSGNNPIQNKYQIRADGTVEKDAVLSEYRIGNKLIQLDKDQGDDLEVNIGKYGPFENRTVTTQMRGNHTTFATDTETRKAAMGHYKGVYEAKNSYDEAKAHEEAGCEPEELTQKEIDGDKDTGHQHFTQEDFEKCVQELMQNDDISDVFSENEIRARLSKNLNNLDGNNNGERAKIDSIEKIKEETEAELEQDAVHFRTVG